MRTPDLLVLDKGQKMCKTADFSGTQVARVEQCQEKKFKKYQDLARGNRPFAASDHMVKKKKTATVEKIAHRDMQCSTT